MTRPENHNGLAGDSETEQVLEHLIFLYTTRQKGSSQTFQKHRFKVVCETSARQFIFLLNIAIKKATKNSFNNTKNIFESSKKNIFRRVLEILSKPATKNSNKTRNSSNSPEKFPDFKARDPEDPFAPLSRLKHQLDLRPPLKHSKCKDDEARKPQWLGWRF